MPPVPEYLRLATRPAHDIFDAITADVLQVVLVAGNIDQARMRRKNLHHALAQSIGDLVGEGGFAVQ